MKEYISPDLFFMLFESEDIITLSAVRYTVLPSGEVSAVFKETKSNGE